VATLPFRRALWSTPPSARNLASLWQSSAPSDWPLAFAEATKPLDRLRTDIWPNADLERAVVSQTHMVTSAPWLDHQTLAYERNVSQTPSPDIPEHLAAALRTFDDHMPNAPDTSMDDDTRAALKALGYLDD
jgi:hypothetical protein